MIKKTADKNKYIAFLDFDNTITTFDVLDDMLERFSANDKWLDLEKRWRAGKIGSRVCLKGQMDGIRVDRSSLDRYLSKVRVDPYYKRLIGLLNSRKIKPIILSDSFDYILKSILRKVERPGVSVYSNRIRLKGDRLISSFPFINKSCGSCAHCKKKNLLSRTPKDHIIIYIGDGLSDVHASQCADMVFAKDALLKYYRSKKLPCVPFKTLKDVYGYFKRNLR